MQPLKIITPTNKRSLKELLRENHLFEEVKSGNKIILSEGRSLTDLDAIIPAGKKIVVVSIDLLGGG